MWWWKYHIHFSSVVLHGVAVKKTNSFHASLQLATNDTTLLKHHLASFYALLPFYVLSQIPVFSPITFNVCTDHDFVSVSCLSVVEGLMSSIVQNQLQSFGRPCCTQNLQAQGSGQLARCHANLHTHTCTLRTDTARAVGTQPVWSMVPHPPTGSMDEDGLSRLDLSSAIHRYTYFHKQDETTNFCLPKTIGVIGDIENYEEHKTCLSL